VYLACTETHEKTAEIGGEKHQNAKYSEMQGGNDKPSGAKHETNCPTLISTLVV
jgi:hypothetical protein